MNNFKTTIGIETHIVLNTKTKLFSPTKSCHTDMPNTNINEIDLGLPGTLPTLNAKAVEKAIILANLLHMKISNTISFTRKHYFYRDLPKGYQITQYLNPIGTNGYILISNGNNQKKINIHAIYLEEDTAKQKIIDNKHILMDYNRCGMPLIEIVTNPDINSPQEASEYLTQLKRILNFSEISDAKLEEGSMRADINISIAPYGIDKLGTKVEIKNINSIDNVTKAIEYEQNRQIESLLLGKQILSQTKRYDDVNNQTIFMRLKSEGVDYHYINEPNIPPISIDNNLINRIISNSPKNAYEVEKKLISLNLDRNIINILLDNYDLFKIFKKVYCEIKDANLTLTWVVVELVGLVKKNGQNLTFVNENKIKNIIEMIKLIQQNKINNKQAKAIISEIYLTNNSTNDIIKKKNYQQITDKKIINNLLREIINENKNILCQYKMRPQRVEKMIIGLLMKKTNGQANPVIATNVLKKILEDIKV